MTHLKFREILSSQMLSYNPVQKHYPGDHKMRAVTKVVRTYQSVRVGEVTEKEFSVAKNKWRVCKDINTLCFYAKKSGFVNKPLKCVWCGLDTYLVCIFCLDSKKKPTPLHLNNIQGNVVGKQ